MYHVEIKKDGKTVEAFDTNAILAAFKPEGGLPGNHALTYLDCDAMTAFDLIMTMDDIRERLFADEPAMKFLYDTKELFIGGSMSIDVSALRNMGRDKE